MRVPVTVVLCAAALAACGDSSAPQTEQSVAATDAMVAPAAAPMEEIADGRGAGFAYATGGQAGKGAPNEPQSGEAYIYDHNMTISMASDFIRLRFERARDKCQNDVALKCKIMSASFQLLGAPDAPLPVARLTVALPHESVDAYEKSLVELLPNERDSDVVVKARSTTAQNVTSQVKDLNARLAQLKNYRDRMMELSKRGGKTEDLIKVESEISQTQASIEQIEAQQRDLAERIAKENLSISFEAQSTVSDAFQPVRDVWQNSLRVMAASGAAVLALFVGIVPWIPVFLLGFFGIRWLWRRMTRA
jgi:hypothetical protein